MNVSVSLFYCLYGEYVCFFFVKRVVCLVVCGWWLGCPLLSFRWVEKWEMIGVAQEIVVFFFLLLLGADRSMERTRVLPFSLKCFTCCFWFGSQFVPVFFLFDLSFIPMLLSITSILFAPCVRRRVFVFVCAFLLENDGSLSGQAVRVNE